MFSSEINQQMIRLYKIEKLRNEVLREYDLISSTLGKRIKQHQNTSSFNHQDYLSNKEKEIIKKSLYLCYPKL